MTMNYKILEANGVENENIDGGAFNHLCSQGKSGIVKDVLNECGVSSIGNVLYLDTGLLLLNGIRIKIISKQEFTLTGTPAIDTNYSLVAKVELKENRDVSFYLDIKSQPELVKDNLYKNENGIYELEIATFIHNVDGNISSLYRTCELIGSTQPTIILDTEISSISENAVQNKVIAEALSGKLDKTGWRQTNTAYVQLYGREHTSGNATMYNLAVSPLSYSIARYNSNGILQTKTPNVDLDCANKKYVDDNFAPKTYTHNITTSLSTVGGIDGFHEFTANDLTLIGTIKSEQKTAYTNLEQLDGLTFERVECWEMSDYVEDENGDIVNVEKLIETLQNVTVELSTRVDEYETMPIFRFKNNKGETVMAVELGSGSINMSVTDIVE